MKQNCLFSVIIKSALKCGRKRFKHGTLYAMKSEATRIFISASKFHVFNEVILKLVQVFYQRCCDK